MLSVALNPLIVVRPSIEPVMTAVFSHISALQTYSHCQKRYSAVSENAEKISTFLLPTLIGCSIFSDSSLNSSCSFVSCCGVMSATIKVSSSRISASSEAPCASSSNPYPQGHFDFLADGEKVCVFIVHVKIVSDHVVHIQISVAGAFKLVNGLNRTINQLLDARQGQLERAYRTFQPFQQVNTHQPANALLATSLGQILALIVRQLLIILDLTCEDVVGGHIDAQAQLYQLLVNLVVVDGIIQVCQAWTNRDRLQPLREFPIALVL